MALFIHTGRFGGRASPTAGLRDAGPNPVRLATDEGQGDWKVGQHVIVNGRFNGKIVAPLKPATGFIRVELFGTDGEKKDFEIDRVKVCDPPSPDAQEMDATDGGGMPPCTAQDAEDPSSYVGKTVSFMQGRKRMYGKVIRARSDGNLSVAVKQNGEKRNVWVAPSSVQLSSFNEDADCPYGKDFDDMGLPPVEDMATDPPVSEAQRKAMGAAMSGKSTLGIPKSVGKEFIDADPGGSLPKHAHDSWTMTMDEFRNFVRGRF
jgi:hypothetical protein